VYSFATLSRRLFTPSLPSKRIRPHLVATEDRVAAGDLLWTGLFAEPTDAALAADFSPRPRLFPATTAPDGTPGPSDSVTERIPVSIRRGAATPPARAAEPKVLGPTLRLPALDADATAPSVAFGLARVTAVPRPAPGLVASVPATPVFRDSTPPAATTAGRTEDDETPLLAVPANEPAVTEWVAPATKGQAEATKTVLAVSTKEELPATHHYVADGRAIGMTIHPSRVAVGGADAAAVGAATAGLTFVRQLTPEVAVYEGLDAGTAKGRAALATSPGVDFAVPVFVIGETNSEAVLLDEVIVALRPGVSAGAFFKGDGRFSDFRPLAGTPDQYVATVAAGPGEAALAVANDLADDKRLAWASPNFFQDWKKFYTPNDPRFANLWHLHNTGQSGGLADADPDLPEAWDVNRGGSAGITVAVVDDGVPTDHPDLLNWVNPGEVAGNGFDDDGNGWVDDLNGWNFVANTANAAPQVNADEHGTSVAGVAVARGDNGEGVAGAAYNSAVMSVRIFNGPTATNDANIVSALYYAAGRTANGTGTWKAADIANNSWGGGGASSALIAALTWGTTSGRQGKGTAYFFATGNGGGPSASQPALQSLTIPGVVGVGAVANTGNRSSYSQYGPGLDFVTPSNGGTLAIDTTDRVGPDGYATGDYTGTGASGFGGTSSATPLAAGIAALVLAQADAKSVSLTAPQLRNYLLNTTDFVGGVTYDPATGRHVEYGTGRLNAFTAVSGIGKPEISVTSSTADLVSGAAVTDFGTVLAGGSKDLTFRVRNQGTSPLTLASLSVAPGPYGVLTGPGATTLNVGEATTFTLRFSPTASGLTDRTVTLASNDTDEPLFTFTARGTGVVPNASGTAFEDWDGDGARDANDPGLAGRVVFADQNDNGVRDISAGGGTFTNSTATPLPDLATVQSTLAVTGLIGAVADLNVRINATHTYTSDLTVSLLAPDGTRVTLAPRVGGSGDNFENTVFDDQAGTAITAGKAPFAGSYRPSGSLATVNGRGGNGNWTLEIVDGVSGDFGNLLDWSLTFATGELFTTTDANGFYAFTNLPTGAYPIRAETPAGWAATGTPAYPVTIATGNETYPNSNFGSAKNDRFYGAVWDDKNGNGTRDAGELPVSGRTAFVDSNANGAYDANGATFTNATKLAIPDTNVPVYSDQAVTGFANPLTDVNVTINITHTYDSDLLVFLIAPDGTRVELFTNVGGTGDNFDTTRLDQQAATAITAGTAPFKGTYRPEGDLNVLNGLSGASVNGTWRLEITDAVGQDTGDLTSWSLELLSGTPEPSMASNALGNVTFDLPAGPADVRLAPAAGFLFTNPADGKHVVTAAGAPLFQRDFGTRVDAPAVTAPPRVNAGAVQRSRVTGMDITFLGTLTAGEQNALTYTLVRLRQADGTTDGTTTISNTGGSPQVAVSYAAAGSDTRATLSFSGAGPGVQATSLAEGVWQLTVRSGTTVLYAGQTTTATGAVYRLFGDIDGNRVIDTADLTQFEFAFGTFPVVAGFDYENNGVIDTADLTQFELRFGASL
jgi:subtilisin-like proprotein convertase family protein/subtilisin family serine protease